MRRKTVALLLSAVMLTTVVISVLGASATASTETTLYGQVTAISGSSITLALATEPISDKTGIPPSGTPTDSAQPSETPSAPPSSSPNTDSDNSGKGTPPSGTPGNGSGTPGSLTLTGETQTITVSDSTVITIDNMGKSTSGTISSISVGNILTVTMSGSTATAISVRQAVQPQQNKVAQNISAATSKSTVTVNGSKVSFQAYNIGGNNYFKLRDVAKAISGTEKQFEIGYDSASNAVILTSGKSYTAVGGELEVSNSTASVNAAVSTVTVTLDGKSVSLTVYNINGNNYFKLRELAAALNFGVTYDSITGTIVIDTSTEYSE